MISEPKQPKVYTTVYSDFKGIDVTSAKNEVYKRRSPDSINMIPDMDGTPKKRGGLKINQSVMTALEYVSSETKGKTFTAQTFGFGVDAIISSYYCNKNVFILWDGETTGTYYTIWAERYAYREQALKITPPVYFDSGWYSMHEEYSLYYGWYQLQADSLQKVTPKTPIITIGRKPTGGGTPYEAVNLLTNEVRETFLGDSKSTDYYTSFPIEKIVKVAYKNSAGNYVSTTNFKVSEDRTHITFTNPHAPVVEGEDNVSIRYTKAQTSASEAYFKSTMFEVYGTGNNPRVFVGGNGSEKYGNRVWYSEPNDISYFPDTNYFITPSNEIIGMVGADDYIYVFQDNGDIHLFYPTTYDNDATFVIKKTINTNTKIQPNTLKVFNQEPIFYSPEKGICTVEINDTDVKVRTKSYYINKEIIGEKVTSATVWDNFYIISIGKYLYLLDGTQKSSWVNDKTDFQYECYKWRFDTTSKITTSVGDKGDLYIAYGDPDFKAYQYAPNSTYSEEGEFACSWTTILDDDGLANYFKNMQKKNCVVTLSPSQSNPPIKVYVKTDNNPYELVYSGSVSSRWNSPTDIYLNKKFKKYKRLQFKIVSDGYGSFGIQQILKMYTIGGFSK